MASIKIEGLEELKKALKENVTMEDVKKVVKQNGGEMHEKIVDNADFTKGYATGTTKGSIRGNPIDGGFGYEVEPTTEYSPYLEHGTRFMDAQPFVKPGFEAQKAQFINDMQKLVKQVVSIDPQQEIYTALMLGIKAKGYDIYDHLPKEEENAKYPFVNMADSRQIDTVNKTCVCGSVFQDLHIWHTNKNRGTVSQMLLDCKSVCRSIEHTKNFAWSVGSVEQRIITDTSTATPLAHGILQVRFDFS